MSHSFRFISIKEKDGHHLDDSDFDTEVKHSVAFITELNHTERCRQDWQSASRTTSQD